jgi:hypothetical protein
LESNNVPEAAGLLRRGLEEFFASLCDALGAEVKYRLDGRNDLGDYLPAAMGKYHSYLKKAKQSARSWENMDLLNQLENSGKEMSSIYTRTNAEQWAVNVNVHFNNWANFSMEDFAPVVKAFQDLQHLFMCVKCESILRTTFEGMTPVNIRCNCGSLNWNLKVKDGK